jgi:4-amino-4-deoxy-L-arabinose transferase-like glycosyltransferase
VRTERWAQPASEPAAIAAAAAGWTDVVSWLSIAAIAGGVAIMVAVGLRPRPMGPDDALYASLAGRWLAGLPLQTMAGDPATIRAPGYVLAAALATLATDDWVAATRVVAAPAAALVVLASGLVARSVGGRLTAIVVCLIVATPTLVVTMGGSGIDTVQLALVLAGLAVGLRAGPGWELRTAVLSGVLLAAAVLVKETSLVLFAWPALAAVCQPRPELRRALRWAAAATLTGVLVVVPWWIWVFAQTGDWFPTQLRGTAAIAGLGLFGVAAVVSLLGIRNGVASRLAGRAGRLGDRGPWGIALAVVGAFTISQARFSLSRRPSVAELAGTLGEVAALVPGPLVAAVALVVVIVVMCVLAANQPPAVRSLLLGLVLISSSTAIVVLMGWEARSTMASVVLALIVAVAAGVQVLRALVARVPRRIPGATAAAGLVAVLTVVVGLAGAWWAYAREPVARGPIRGWGSPTVQLAADWLAQHAAPGETIVTSWLFGWSFDADTAARYHWLLQPTLQLRVGRLGEMPLVPVGTLFREPAPVPRETSGDFLFVRYHETEHYYVGLEASALVADLKRPGVGHLVVSGESAQSSAGITTALDRWPGLHREIDFVDGPRRIIVYSVDPGSVRAAPSDVQMTGSTVRSLAADVARLRKDVTPGAYLRSLLDGRTLTVFPPDEDGENRATRLLHAP